jgi:hypothetical protein
VETEARRKSPDETHLGEIEARIVGMQYYDAETDPGEWMNLEREPENSHDERAIRIENGRFEAVGHLPRQLASWLSPLIDAGKLRVEGSVPKTAGRNNNSCPITLIVFVCDKGRNLLNKTDVTGKLEALHEVVRKAYEDARGYGDADTILGLAEGLRPMDRQDLLPETHLLLAMMPAMARQARTARAAETMAKLRGLMHGLTIGDAMHHHNLSLFPLTWSETSKPPYVLLATAIERGEAVVKEVDEDGEVSNLSVSNQMERPLLISEGEILVGAKQNRVVNVSVLVAARSTLTLPVTCVEQGRWEYRTQQFRTEFCAPPSLRSKSVRAVHETRASRGTAEGDQGGIWEEVDECLASMRLHSKTASLTDGIQGVEDKLQEYREKLTLPNGTAGVIVAQGDQVVGMDLFDCPATLTAIWPRLSAAYFFDALRNQRRRKRTPQIVAEEFVDRVIAHIRPRAAALGLGDELEIAGDSEVGAALLFADKVCHLSAFSES